MSKSDNSVVPVKHFILLYICSQRGFKRRLTMYSAYALSLVKGCVACVSSTIQDCCHIPTCFSRCCQSCVNVSRQVVEPRIYFYMIVFFFSFVVYHLWKSSICFFHQTMFSFFFFFLISGSFIIGFWWDQTFFRVLKLVVKVVFYPVICKCPNSVLLSVFVCIKFFFSSTSLII